MLKEKYIPVEKMSKKEQRKQQTARRGSWNGVVPVTKVIPDRKKHPAREQKIPSDWA